MKASILKTTILLLIALLTTVGFFPGLTGETPRHIAAGATPTPAPTPRPASSPREAPARVEVESVILKPGLRYNGDARVWVKNVGDPSGLGAYDLQIAFDPTKMKINSVTGGAAPFQNIAAHNADAGANTTGKLKLNGFHSSSPGPNGNVHIATINLSTLTTTAGTYTLSPSITTLVNIAGNDIPAAAASGFVFAYDPPIADFSASPPTSGAVPLTVKFTDLSTGPPTAWAWDLDGNGTADSSTRNPSVTYNTPGNYTVSLTAGNPQGTDTRTVPNYIRVYGAPNADFATSKTRGRAPLIVNFSDQSTGNITAWEWDLNGDSTIDTSSRNPTYWYTRPGKYTVSLKASNLLGNDTEIKTDYITVTKLKVKKFFRIEVDSDGVVVLPIDIGDLTDPDTGEKIKPNKGIKEFRGEVNFNSALASMLGGRRGGPNFNDPAMTNSPGKSTFSGSSNTPVKHEGETRIAKLIPRLTGNKDALLDIVLSLQSIIEGDDDTEMEEEEITTLSFRRGAARGGTSSSITDVLFIAQYLAGLRDISSLNPLNAASIRHDGDGGDKISITDALFLAQALAALRDNNFNLIP